jgi:HEPN domain-containing protein
LVFQDIDPPKIHDLNTLVKLCQDIDCNFSEVEIACASLTRYGVASRYPREIFVDDAIAKALIERARKIYDFSVAKINP